MIGRAGKWYNLGMSNEHDRTELPAPAVEVEGPYRTSSLESPPRELGSGAAPSRCADLQRVRGVLERYLGGHPQEREELLQLIRFLDAASDWREAISRKNPAGHLTASAMVVRRSDRRAVLVRHAALGKLLQPGGHIEPEDSSTLAAALREAEEETPLRGFEVVPTDADPLIPIDIDCHFIPANPAKGEGPHFHFDLRYVLLFDGEVEGDFVLRPLPDFAGAGDLERLAVKTARLLGSG
ncbi:MAG: NUDIX domain-containing protein [Candidatus Wallbacteria bacterium]|nr:NUDIX domain-containing protein [Candidatus Wallbacteria bacterium]